jgi:hypothetical protein
MEEADVDLVSPLADSSMEVASEQLEATGFAYKVLSAEGRFWHYSWRVNVRNLGIELVKLRVKIEYRDSEGFPLASNTQYPEKSLQPGEALPVSEEHHIKADLAARITNARILVSVF